MGTITFDENINLGKKHFKTLEDFLLYLVQKRQSFELSASHKEKIDERLAESKENPDNFLSINELKSAIKRK
jgi:low affinity Fe/Cu permease